MAFTKGKVVFVGDTDVGKTSIIYHYLNSGTPFGPTIAGNSTPVKVTIDDEKSVDLCVWDTSGQENFNCLVPLYAKMAQVAVIVFDITNQTSFDNLPKWMEYLKDKNIPHLYLVGNKIDLVDEWQLPRETAAKYAESHDMKFFFTSAVTGENINFLFEDIAHRVDDVDANVQSHEAPISFVQDDQQTQQKSNDSCFC